MDIPNVCGFGKSDLLWNLYNVLNAVLVDKDNSPKWNPSIVEAVTEEMVNSFFTPFTESDEEELRID